MSAGQDDFPRHDPEHDPSLDFTDISAPAPAPAADEVAETGSSAPDAIRYVPEPAATRRTRSALAIAAVAVYLAGIVVWIVLGALDEPTTQIAAALVALGPFIGAIYAWYFPGRHHS